MPTMSVYVSDEVYQFLSRKAGKDKRPTTVAREILEDVMNEEVGESEDRD